jgi:hypothetical protein
MTHSTCHSIWDQPINTQPATEQNQIHPDPARKLSTNLVCKQRIILYRQNPMHILEYFTVLTSDITQNFIYNRFYNFNYIVHVYTLVIFTHLWNFNMTYTTAVCVQWKMPDDGQRNCPKHVEIHSKNKFEKLMHLVGFIIWNLTRCMVTWTSKFL